MMQWQTPSTANTFPAIQIPRGRLPTFGALWRRREYGRTDSRATQRADNGPDRAREQSADQRTCRRTHGGAHQTSAQDARNELRWGLAALACGARDRRDCGIGLCEDQHRTVWVARPGSIGSI